MSSRRARTGMGKTNSPERSQQGTPRSPPRDELRPPHIANIQAAHIRSTVDGVRIAPYQRAPGEMPYQAIAERLKEAQDRADTPRASRRSQGSATPRSLPLTPREPGPLLARLSDEQTRSRPRTHASAEQEALAAPLSQEASLRTPRSSASTRRTCTRMGAPDLPDKQAVLQAEQQVQGLKRRFLEKNEAKVASLPNIFRVADMNKLGSLGREELTEACQKVGIEPKPEMLEYLLTTRATDLERMSFGDFMRFFDDRMGNMTILKRPLQQQTGDCAKMAHLWVPTKPEIVGSREVGTLNDVLEADRREDGHYTERLDGNFSGVQYNILNFDEAIRPIPPSVIVPIKKRDTLYEFPHPHGRRVSYDHGDTPWNVVSVRTPRINKRTSLLGLGVNDNNSGGDTWRRQTMTTNVPVRLHAFTRIHQGGLPTQEGMMLGIMTPIIV